MTDVLFYHLQRQPLEKVLPVLLVKTLERGWNAVIESPDPNRIAALDEHLWVFSDDSFLPHSTDQDPDAEHEPILLTQTSQNLNKAAIRFLIDGAALPEQIEEYQRLVVLFDGQDQDALMNARVQWKAVKGQGFEATYWQQDENDRWEKKA